MYKSSAYVAVFIGCNTMFFNGQQWCISVEVFVATRKHGVTALEAARHEKRKSRKLLLYYALILDKYDQDI